MANVLVSRVGLAVACLAMQQNARVEAADDQTRGAAVPWTTYEAEQLRTNGMVLGPDYAGQSPAREASGRKCVRLAHAGDFIELQATADTQGLVVRYSIPDSTDGRGSDATLSLLVNGQPRQKLALTSRYTHRYGKYPFTNAPEEGSPRQFWDELRLILEPIHHGDTLRLQKNADDVASEYLIDFVDLESLARPLPMPAGAVSVRDYGAKGDGHANDLPAFQAAVAAAQARRGTVWVPPGRYRIEGSLTVRDVAVQGAGMWHSTLVGPRDATPERRVRVEGVGPNVTLADFAIIGALDYRNDTEPNDGLGGFFGTGSVVRNVWVEHTKTGAWLTNSDGLLVEGCRFRNTIADGLNLCVGMRDTVVRNCTARGTGDDCFAVWPATYAPAAYASGGNRLVNCTAQLPALAQGFSLYGGDGNAVEDCVAVDVPYGAGLFASTTFPTAGGFSGLTRFTRCRLLRTGGHEGAIGTVADKLDLSGLRFADIDVTDSAADAIRFTSMHGHKVADTVFERVRVAGAGLVGRGHGVAAGEDAAGTATLRDLQTERTRSGPVSVGRGFILVRDGPTAAAPPPAGGSDS